MAVDEIHNIIACEWAHGNARLIAHTVITRYTVRYVALTYSVIVLHQV